MVDNSESHEITQERIDMLTQDLKIHRDMVSDYMSTQTEIIGQLITGTESLVNEIQNLPSKRWQLFMSAAILVVVLFIGGLMLRNQENTHTALDILNECTTASQNPDDPHECFDSAQAGQEAALLAIRIDNQCFLQDLLHTVLPNDTPPISPLCEQYYEDFPDRRYTAVINLDGMPGD